jgi:hypothetical protein
LLGGKFQKNIMRNLEIRCFFNTYSWIDVRIHIPQTPSLTYQSLVLVRLESHVVEEAIEYTSLM